jgi:hypothetical protein
VLRQNIWWGLLTKEKYSLHCWYAAKKREKGLRPNIVLKVMPQWPNFLSFGLTS